MHDNFFLSSILIEPLWLVLLFSLELVGSALWSSEVHPLCHGLYIFHTFPAPPENGDSQFVPQHVYSLVPISYMPLWLNEFQTTPRVKNSRLPQFKVNVCVSA